MNKIKQYQTIQDSLYRIRIWIVVILIKILTLFPVLCYAKANNCFIKQIQITENPLSLDIKLTDTRPYKIIQVDSNEFLIAFKDVYIAKNLNRVIKKEPLIKNLQIDAPQSGIVTIAVNTGTSTGQLKTKWNYDNKTLSILIDSHTIPSPSLPVPKGINEDKHEKKISDDNTAKLNAQINGQGKNLKEISSIAIPIQSFYEGRSKKIRGTIDDIIFQFEKSECIRLNEITYALNYCMEDDWYKAFEIINQYINKNKTDNPKGLDKCYKDAHFLRAYTLLKIAQSGDESKLLEASDLFHDTIVFFPDSDYIPYAYTALGKIYMSLKNNAVAKGYFKIVLDKYKNFPGISEAMLALGQIYSKNNQLNIAIEMFKEVISKYPDSDYLADAKIELGKALYDTEKYDESMSILLGVAKSHPWKTYESKDFSLYLGNNLFHIKKYKEARDSLIMAYNFFPEVGLNPLLIIKIADTYAEEKDEKKAITFYKMVMDKFPGSDAYAFAAIKYAQLIKNDDDRERIYNQIISEFPTNPMFKVALLKLSELQQKKGLYEDSIKTARNLLITSTKLLEKEAEYVTANSYLQIFKKLLEEKDYPNIIERFTKTKPVLEKSPNPEILQIVGKAYLESHIYEKAIEALIKSHNLYTDAKRPPELVLDLGIAFHEVKKLNLAYKLFNIYIKDYPNAERKGEAYFRTGNIFLEENEYAEAIKNFKAAYPFYHTDKEKASILIMQSKSYKGLNNTDSAQTMLIEAINILSSDPDKNSLDIYKAYQDLGECYVQSQMYLKAAESFTMAMKFSEKNGTSSDLRFTLGELYQKGNDQDKAVKVFQEIIASGDEFWGKLAQEKLKTMELEKKLRSS